MAGGRRVRRGGADIRMAALTRPSARVMVRTKWEVNITIKYRVASCAMIPRIPGTLNPGALDAAAMKIINENARESDSCVIRGISTAGGILYRANAP